MAGHPWSALPRSLAATLAPVLPETVAATVTAIAAEVPAYRGAWDSRVGPTVRRGVEIALSRMLDLFGTDDAALTSRNRRFYERIGSVEYEQGRSLEALLAAYRTGARVSWERFSAAALEASVAPADLAVLAESIFVYIDELSAVSAQGHARADAAGRGYRDVVRSQLAQALIDGVAAREPGRVNALAQAARWPVPRRLVVAVVPKAHAGPSLPTAPADVLIVEREADAVAVVPDPVGPGRRQRLTRGLTGPVFVGTVQPPAGAALSYTQAVALRDLATSGRVPGTGVVLAVDHLPELLVAANPVVFGEIQQRVREPLADLPGRRREVLAETLAAWVDHQGDRSAMAEALVVHPQTISYRMTQLRARYGDLMGSPRGRLLLQLAQIGRADGVATPDE